MRPTLTTNELDGSTFQRAGIVLKEALSGGVQLTRTELAQALEDYA
jgi:hypothetical protein